MKSDVIVLGVGSAMPMRTRHFSSCAVRRGGEVLLFDCGEGTQFQLLAANLKAPRLVAVFITHFHGDHFFGLPGLLSTLHLLRFAGPLTLVGPRGLAAALHALPSFGARGTGFDLAFVELDAGFGRQIVYETAGYTVEARPLQHSIFAAGYRYAEKPKPGHLDVEKARALGVTDFQAFRALKAGEAVPLGDGRVVQPEAVVGPPTPGAVFAYITDTRPCEGGRQLARGADLVFHEATFAEARHARAVETGHSTAREAAEVAQAAGAHRLLLGHFSTRYPDPAVLVEEARAVFPNSEAAVELKAYDF